MNKVKKVIISIAKHFDDDTIKTTTSEFENVYIEWEQGIKKHYYEDKCVHLELNGYSRIMIKAWNKGKNWDDFIKEEEVKDTIPIDVNGEEYNLSTHSVELGEKK